MELNEMEETIQKSVDRVFGGVSAIQKQSVNGQYSAQAPIVWNYIYYSDLRKFSNDIEGCDEGSNACFIVELRFTIDTTAKMVNGKNLDMSLRSGIELLQGKLLIQTRAQSDNILDDLNQIFEKTMKNQRTFSSSGKAIAIKRRLQRVSGRKILIYVATVGAVLTLSYRLVWTTE